VSRTDQLSVVPSVSPCAQGFQVESFQELCEIDVGDVGWKACMLPLQEWPPA